MRRLTTRTKRDHVLILEIEMTTIRETLPDFFPAQIAACAAPSTTFFDCFTENSQKKSLDDVKSGLSAIKICQKELDAYEACMKKNLPNVIKTDKKFRVRD